MIQRSFDQLAVGMREQITKTITDDVVRGFAQLTEDCNPLHLDEEYASGTIFKKRIAHGMIGAGLISAVLGTKLPGLGSIYLSQELKFKAPVYIGETVTAVAEITALDPAKKRVTLSTWCENEQGKKVVEGTAIIMLNQ